MSRLLVFSVLLFSFHACKESPRQDVVVKGQSVTRLPVQPEKVEGMYTGQFKGSPLTIVLSEVTDKQASGFDRHKGITRNLTGVVDFDGGKLHLYLVEPGDSRFDGQFHLALDTAGWRGEGSWKSFVTGNEIPFRIQKREIKKEGEGRVFMDAFSNYIVLKTDGSCLYNYQLDSTNAAAPVTITGRYKKVKGSILIQWQKNALYPTGKSTFKLVSERAYKGENYTQESLHGEGREFSEIVF